ncbi:MAG: Eco57I restriction-modification methylase domain-containing protein, partial [Pseudomonadota bacterium]
TAKGLGKIQHRSVEIPPLDAVVGNPPYIRQEEIPRDAKREKGKYKKGTKEYYLKLILEEGGIQLSGRSDIHCYFWPHAASFLKDDGWLCLLTSSQWLDVEYGFRLQAWILDQFEILAVFESIDEPWFVGARVTTTVTILRRQPERAKRMANTVRFVQLRRPIGELLAHDGTTFDAIRAADDFRNEILSLAKNTVNDRYRARLIRQEDLWREGVRLGAVMGKSGETDEDGEEQAATGEYYGGKWGVYLRAPDLWFDLLDEFSGRFTPLGEIANIHRGITSGKDSFFFPIDHTTEALKIEEDPARFRKTYGVPREVVESREVCLVRCGEERGEIRPLEAKFLEPEVHSLMEVDGFTVAPEDCGRRIVLIGKTREALEGTYAGQYVAWGEEKKVHQGSTCAARETEERAWYDLTGHRRGSLFWPMAQQYKHAIPVNEHDLICNHNLFDLFPRQIDGEVLGGILNSTWVVLSKFQYGRPVGVEGNLKTEVVDVNMMRVPDPRRVDGDALARVREAFRKLKGRKTLQFLSARRMREMAWRQAGKETELEKLSDLCELDMADRRELDDAVLEMLGVSSAKRREEMIDALYCYLREFFERTRQKEEKAILNKNKARRRGKADPAELAAQIYQELGESYGDFLRRYDPDFLDKMRPFDTYEIPPEGVPVPYRDMFVPHSVRFIKGKKTQIALLRTQSPVQDDLIVLLVRSGLRGLVRVPHEENECRRVLGEYESFVGKRENLLRRLIEERSADEDLQQMIYDALLPLVLSGRREEKNR